MAFNSIQKSWDFIILIKYSLATFSLVWSAGSSIIYFLERLYLITFIKGFKICALLLNQMVGSNCRENRAYCEREMITVLSSFRRLESLTDEFNDTFGYIFALDLLALFMAILIITFQMIIFLISGNITNGLGYSLPVTIQLFVLVLICDAANEFEIQARKCTSNLKNISSRWEKIPRHSIIQITMQVTKGLVQPIVINPGSLFRINRRSLTSIASSVTTYMVVLVQFYQGDSSESNP
ncbi:unnamed protein product [Orchesella dallaii]|uniref:Uncharacterized protein n=1 Tax=Orchesella dallaii TaxID=48710 RepID=A0ABP1R2K6_9HEXA